MNLKVTETLHCPDIEQAALAAHTCIRPGGINHVIARETW
jgi:hypothetical protein